MVLNAKDASNNTVPLKTVNTGNGHAGYHNELAPLGIRVTRGDEPDFSVVRVNSEHPTVGFQQPGSEEDLWFLPERYTYPTIAGLVDVSSLSANDTSAGTGAQTVLLSGLNASHVEVSETITMNGTSKVASANQYLRINSIKVMTAGTLGYNNGRISVETAGSPTDFLAIIPEKRIVSTGSHFTVPTAKTAFFRSMTVSSASGVDMRYFLMIRTSATDAVFTPIEVADVYQGTRVINLSLYELSAAGETDIVVRASRMDGSGDVAATANITMVIVNDSAVIA